MYSLSFISKLYKKTPYGLGYKHPLGCLQSVKWPLGVERSGTSIHPCESLTADSQVTKLYILYAKLCGS